MYYQAYGSRWCVGWVPGLGAASSQLSSWCVVAGVIGTVWLRCVFVAWPVFVQIDNGFLLVAVSMHGES